ncbi:MAG: inositol monophosphatase family protein [Rothia sp. (in: high G+C Gram-positive bacteria)]|uniref:inositol monophosphatase family protein n=1 Tax=Rothia sp. (in: high G+C Gram-positive bacteria) TaxID=1885016 RepID=UPI0026DFB94A|nr:inositol monophosphatase family protein [Rothia sp. (in: high G+C Gram-positive bacteria)]MDO5750144.1 inositol monophosphatase family protein [Rothia sp. (in: high G+C Gram-positive bacteria)]
MASPNPYTDDLRLAHILADSADRVSLQAFKSVTAGHMEGVQLKEDGSAVTAADREVEQLIRAQLSRVRTRDGIVGEEFGSTGTAARQWVIDPIDGTANFMRGVPVWATLIALLDQGEPVVGVVSAPALGRRWWAVADGGAYAGKSLSSASRLSISSVEDLEDSSLTYASLAGWGERREPFVDLLDSVKRSRGFGEFWAYMLMAEGAVDIAVEPGLEIYDKAALVPIVREAGGVITSLDGSEPLDSDGLLAAVPALHGTVLDRLNPAG